MLKTLTVFVLIVFWGVSSSQTANAQHIDFKSRLLANDTNELLNYRSSPFAEYGPGLTLPVYPLLFEKNVNLTAHLQFHCDQPLTRAKLVFQVLGGDGKSLSWEALPINFNNDSIGFVQTVVFSHLFPRSLPKNTVLKMYVWNPGKWKLEVDNLIVDLNEVQLPHFGMVGPLANGIQMDYCLRYAMYNKDQQGKLPETNALCLAFRDTIAKTDSSITLKVGTEVAQVLLTISKKGSAPMVYTYNVKTTFLSDVALSESAIRLRTDSIVEVYRQTGLMDTAHFQSNYWLNKGGVKWMDAQQSTYLTYHNTQVSSLQLQPYNHVLKVNLDFAADHPLLHFPLMDSAKNNFVDASPALFHKGDEVTNTFTVYKCSNGPMPRLLNQPDGFLSTIIWTEHADWTDLRTHRAVYFGNENIKSARRATGGFVKYGIPVTKSIFYINPTGWKNKGIFEGKPIASVLETKGYLKFLKQLEQCGNEICLHTPSQFSDGQSTLLNASQFMQENFKSTTWIDHGYDNGPTNNREDLVADGLNPASINYVGELWKSTGVKYVWNCYYEDTCVFKGFQFNNAISFPYAGFGDAFPVPQFFKHPTRTSNFYSFTTTNMFLPDGMADYYLNDDRLKEFAYGQGSFIFHFYPSSSIESHRFWTVVGPAQTIVVQPGVDKALQLLKSYREQGLINTSTIKTMGGYWEALEHVQLIPLGNGTYRVINGNKQAINGLSFIVKGKGVTLLSQEGAKATALQQKTIGNQRVFWLNVKAKGQVDLKVE